MALDTETEKKLLLRVMQDMRCGVAVRDRWAPAAGATACELGVGAQPLAPSLPHLPAACTTL